MRRALELATLGAGKVSPNPMVGCVVVHQDKVIGEGWHQQYGGPHAEVHAIRAVADAALLPESTLYVSLEPCAHFGKTPPCADLIIANQIKKVVVCNLDPNPLVAGAGLARLKAAGIETIDGILAEEGRKLNHRFFTFMEQKRPYIILKWAETADGFIARKNYDSKWISNTLSRKMVHRWRAEEDAILVGTNTAKLDNPQLNVRDWSGRNPVRLVIDRHLRLSPALSLFDQKQETICYNLIKDENTGKVTFVKLGLEGFIEQMVTDLFRRQIASVIVEGGTTLLREFLKLGLWDEARVFKSAVRFEEGIPAPQPAGTLEASQKILDDSLYIYKNLR